VAGSGEWAAEKVLAHRLGVGDRVQFPGFLDPEALDAELRKAQCAIFTSRLEGFGNAPVEAMARRCPVVAANTSAMPEVIGDAGILVTAGNVRAFAAGTLAIVRHERLRADLSERAAARVQRFRWSESARRMAELLRETADIS
jgi:glycosyltransferase involved in cell wall biosynthesis